MSSPSSSILTVLSLLSISVVLGSCASGPRSAGEYGGPQTLAASRRFREDRDRFEDSRRRSGSSIRDRFNDSLGPSVPVARPDSPARVPSAREPWSPPVPERTAKPVEPEPRRELPAVPAAPTTSRTKASPELQKYIDGLKNPRMAEKTFWKLTSASENLIAEMIELVESKERMGLEIISILAVDPDYVLHGKRFLASDIPGMGAVERFDSKGLVDWKAYSMKSYNTSRNGRGYRVVLKKFGGFTLGMAMRSALLNRFMLAVKQNKLPEIRQPQGIDHRRHLRNWWRNYHAMMRDDLKLPESSP